MAKQTSEQTDPGQAGQQQGGAEQEQAGVARGQPRSRRGKRERGSAVEEIRGLILLDHAAVQAYQIAAQACTIQEISQTLDAFRGDHERHVRELSEALRGMGGEAPEFLDESGQIIVGYTRLSALEDRSALVAMRGNEELTNEAYLSARSSELPDEVRRLVEANWQDEQHHIRWIEEEIRDRGWALPEVPAEVAKAA
ncbi:MAG: ferritin-like domain-containing protein [Polyangiaceae bacterium]|nr:ferritin-like domain-containing protein [Polyangiaceae bacterium]